MSVSLLMVSTGDVFASKNDAPLIEENKTSQSLKISSGQDSSDLIPADIKHLVAKQTALEQCLENQSPFNLVLVCHEWRQIINEQMKVDNPCWKAWYGVLGHEDIYETFLKGVLIYRPTPNSDEGMIQLKISDLKNPLQGTFDLSQCGGADKFLTISTGYRGYQRGVKMENKDKLEIWIAPHFMIQKKLTTTAQHFKPIMAEWNQQTAPFGVFFTSGDWNNNSYDYCTSQNLNFVSSNTLYHISYCAKPYKDHGSNYHRYIMHEARRTSFHVCFVNRNKDY